MKNFLRVRRLVVLVVLVLLNLCCFVPVHAEFFFTNPTFLCWIPVLNILFAHFKWCCRTAADCDPGLDCFSNQCIKLATGRPFRGSDSNKDGMKPVSASSMLLVSDPGNAGEWSHREDKEEAKQRFEHLAMANQGLVEEWTQRGLGEHASIASFAAFALQLMANAAPPELIQKALQAANDELRHAKTSFTMASMLLGKNDIDVEPGPFPPSSIQLSFNRTALGLGAALDGCIEETLSALHMASLVQNEEETNSQSASNDESELKALIASKNGEIALEEGQHSALAWLTVYWICHVEAQACQAIQDQVLNSEHLGKVIPASKHLSGEGLQAWSYIWKELLPRISMAAAPNSVVGSGLADAVDSDTPNHEVDTVSFTMKIAKDIVSNVVSQSLRYRVSNPKSGLTMNTVQL